MKEGRWESIGWLTLSLLLYVNANHCRNVGICFMGQRPCNRETNTTPKWSLLCLEKHNYNIIIICVMCCNWTVREKTKPFIWWEKLPLNLESAPWTSLKDLTLYQEGMLPWLWLEGKIGKGSGQFHCPTSGKPGKCMLQFLFFHKSYLTVSFDLIPNFFSRVDNMVER